MSYDVKCYDLAKVWLQSSGDNCDVTIARLAQTIQDAIEDFEADVANEDARNIHEEGLCR